MNERADKAAHFGSLITVTQCLAALTYGWELLAMPLLSCIVVFGARLVPRRYRSPESETALVVLSLLIILAGAAGMSGGLRSPMAPFLVIPLWTQAVYFRAAVSTVCAAVTGVLMMLLAAAQILLPSVAHAPPAPVYLQAFAAVTLLLCLTAALGHLARSDAGARGEASVDVLTGVFNRRALGRHFDDTKARVTSGLLAEQSAVHIGVIVFDVDHFKSVNDAHGHERGDAVLRELAARLGSGLRAGDMLYRVGGEEFVVLAAGADLVQTVAVAERLRQTVRAATVSGLPITVSAGAFAGHAENADLDEMLARADDALYAAKRGGRDRVCSYAPAPTATTAGESSSPEPADEPADPRDQDVPAGAGHASHASQAGSTSAASSS